jgi:lysophospholipase L1-like esterase
MKKLLLLGDSIREGYQPFVKEGLAGKMEVVAPPENCRFAKYTLWGVNLWIRDLGTPDVVHWNNGAWDLHHEAPMVEALTPLDEYLETLRRIAHEIRRTGAKLIFATTTPAGEGAVGRSNAEIDQYNAAAIELMKKERTPVNDLNRLVRQNPTEYICPDHTHLTEPGYRACARQVIEAVVKAAG